MKEAVEYFLADPISKTTTDYRCLQVTLLYKILQQLEKLNLKNIEVDYMPMVELIEPHKSVMEQINEKMSNGTLFASEVEKDSIKPASKTKSNSKPKQVKQTKAKKR